MSAISESRNSWRVRWIRRSGFASGMVDTCLVMDTSSQLAVDPRTKRIMLYSVSRNIRDVKLKTVIVMKRNPPGPSARTILGSRRQASADRIKFLVGLSRTYGDIVHL